jgi:hypothetical protein
MSEFDSLFDEYSAEMNTNLEEVLASEFTLELTNGDSLPIKASFDTSYTPPTRGDNIPMFLAEEGVLSVYTSRLEKDLVLGAKVNTPMGVQYIANVFYPDKTETTLVLGKAGANPQGTDYGNFLK